MTAESQEQLPFFSRTGNLQIGVMAVTTAILAFFAGDGASKYKPTRMLAAGFFAGLSSKKTGELVMGRVLGQESLAPGEGFRSLAKRVAVAALTELVVRKAPSLAENVTARLTSQGADRLAKPND